MWFCFAVITPCELLAQFTKMCVDKILGVNLTMIWQLCIVTVTVRAVSCIALRIYS